MHVQHFTNANFEAEVLSSAQPVLVDFWAPWCGPCRMMAPVLDEVAQALPDVTVGKVNIDDEPALAQAYGVMSIPTLAVFQNGKLQQISAGMRPKKDVLALLGR